MRLIALVLAALALVAFAPPAMAQSCDFSVSSVNFGRISIGPGGTGSTSAALKANCSGQPGQTITICPNIGEGTGGSASGSPRYMVNGASRIGYDLLQPNGQVWGSFLWPNAPRPPPLSLTLDAAGYGGLTQNITASISGAIAGATTGHYMSNVAGAQATFDYGYAPGHICGSLAAQTAQAPFTVQADVIATCSLATWPMDFGTIAGRTVAQAAVGQISVTCTQAVPYTISLSNGSNGGLGPALRRMASPSGSQYLSYGLYQDAARTLPWGQTPGVDTLGSSGSGGAQNYKLYGDLPQQSPPEPGSYSDTVVVTVNY